MRIIIFIVFLTLLGSCKDKGLVETKYENGQLMERYHISPDSLKEGKFERWYESGALFEESNYKSGKLEGQRTVYYESGAKEILENYKDGKLTGEYFTYYEDGNVKVKSNYDNHVLMGEFIKYYPTGNILEKVTMANNTENGPFEEYYENGNLKWRGTFKDGDNEFGLLENFDSTGLLVKKMMCDSLRICKTIWELNTNEE